MTEEAYYRMEGYSSISKSKIAIFYAPGI